MGDTQYIEKTEKECHQEQIQKFRQACQTVYKNSCQTVNKQVCSQQYRQESQPYTETECSSQQKTDCESRWEEDGYGGKKWVEVPSTCQQNNYDTCRDVQKQKLVQVPTLTARMFHSSNASRCLSNSASRSPTQLPSRFARMCTGRSLRGLAGRCQRRPAEVATLVAVGQLQRDRPTMGVADTGRGRAATSLCSQGLLEVPTPAPMLKAPPKPGLAVMLSTLVKFV